MEDSTLMNGVLIDADFSVHAFETLPSDWWLKFS